MKSPGAPIKDLTGKTFNHWTVLSQAPPDPTRCSQTLWRCQCSCGVIKEQVMYCSLTSGRSGSCGHVKREQGARRKAKACSAKTQATYIWRGQSLKLTQIARLENVDAQELRRLVVVRGISVSNAVIDVRIRCRTFHERATSHGATGLTRTGTTRTRWTKHFV